MNVEIWSDIACPWCYVGKRRFEAALARFEHRDEVQVTWRSFELDPSAPPERVGDHAEHLARKYGMDVSEARARHAQMTEMAAAEGVTFRFDALRGGSTFDAHRIVHLAEAHGLQDAMKERLLRAYFSEGRLISDHETLAELAAELGLPADEIGQVLAGERFAAEVRDDERTAQQLGISAVPTFVVDRALGASGAHPPDDLLRLLRQGWDASRPVSVVAAGESCDVDGC